MANLPGPVMGVPIPEGFVTPVSNIHQSIPSNYLMVLGAMIIKVQNYGSCELTWLNFVIHFYFQ